MRLRAGEKGRKARARSPLIRQWCRWRTKKACACVHSHRFWAQKRKRLRPECSAASPYTIRTKALQSEVCHFSSRASHAKAEDAQRNEEAVPPVGHRQGDAPRRRNEPSRLADVAKAEAQTARNLGDDVRSGSRDLQDDITGDRPLRDRNY